MSDIKIPKTLKHDEDLTVEFPKGASSIFVAVYESPRAHYSAEDIQRKNPTWRGDVFEISHDDDVTSNEVTLKMRRGADGKRALYGKYLVKASAVGTQGPINAEAIIEILPKP